MQTKRSEKCKTRQKSNKQGKFSKFNQKNNSNIHQKFWGWDHKEWWIKMLCLSILKPTQNSKLSEKIPYHLRKPTINFIKKFKRDLNREPTLCELNEFEQNNGISLTTIKKRDQKKISKESSSEFDDSSKSEINLHINTQQYSGLWEISDQDVIQQMSEDKSKRDQAKQLKGKEKWPIYIDDDIDPREGTYWPTQNNTEEDMTLIREQNEKMIKIQKLISIDLTWDNDDEQIKEMAEINEMCNNRYILDSDTSNSINEENESSLIISEFLHKNRDIKQFEVEIDNTNTSELKEINQIKVQKDEEIITIHSNNESNVTIQAKQEWNTPAYKEAKDKIIRAFIDKITKAQSKISIKLDLNIEASEFSTTNSNKISPEISEKSTVLEDPKTQIPDSHKLEIIFDLDHTLVYSVTTDSIRLNKNNKNEPNDDIHKTRK